MFPFFSPLFLSQPTTMADSLSLDFHPDFVTPVDGIIFQSSDGKAFRFDISVLVTFSSFFRDLKSIPTTTTADSTSVITVPVAGDSLLWALRAIKSICCGRPLPSLSYGYGYGNERYKLFDDVLVLVDAYDLPVLGRALLDAAMNAPARLDARHTFDVYALACIMNDKTIVSTLSETMALLHSDGLKSMSDWATRTLRTKDAMTLLALHELHSGWTSPLADFQTRGLTAGEFTNFNRTCQRQGCSVHDSYRGDFGRFIGNCSASIAIALCRDLPKILLGMDILCKSDLELACATCHGRAVDLLRSLSSRCIKPACYLLAT